MASVGTRGRRLVDARAIITGSLDLPSFRVPAKIEVQVHVDVDGEEVVTVIFHGLVLLARIQPHHFHIVTVLPGNMFLALHL